MKCWVAKAAVLPGTPPQGDHSCTRLSSGFGTPLMLQPERVAATAECAPASRIPRSASWTRVPVPWPAAPPCPCAAVLSPSAVTRPTPARRHPALRPSAGAHAVPQGTQPSPRPRVSTSLDPECGPHHHHAFTMFTLQSRAYCRHTPVARRRVGRAAATIRWSGMCDPPCNMRSPLHMRQLIAMRVRVYV